MPLAPDMIALAPRLVPAKETVANTTIHALYARFDRKAVRWAAKVGVSCPTGLEHRDENGRRAERASEQGNQRMSLMVSRDNPALALYEQCGFRVSSNEGDSYLMIRDI